MIADFWKNYHDKDSNIPIVLRYLIFSLCILLALSLVMSLVADVKSESTTERHMSNEEVASSLSNSELEAVVPQSLGEHHPIDVEEPKCPSVARNDKQQVDEKRSKDAALGNEVGNCKSQNLATAETITKSSGDAGDTGKTLAAVSALEAEHIGKEVCMQKDAHCSGVVCTPAEKAGCSAETKVCDGKGDAQEAVDGFGKLNVDLSENRNDKTSSVEAEKERKETSEDDRDEDKLKKSDENDVEVIEIIAEPYVEVGGAKPFEDVHDESDEAADEDGSLMGYHFNDDEVLIDKDGKQFEFRVYDEHARNQKRYEKLGQKIDNYIYDLLETRCKLKKIYIPLDAKEGEPRSFLFASDGAFKTDDKLIIFIHGSGVVRAGQWARSLIINQSLRHGTQIPFIERALTDGYEVIVLNTNLNSLSKDRWPSADQMIRGSEDPERHALYVWENLIEKEAKAKHIAIVAHSFGGVVTHDLVSKKHVQFSERVFALAFTDSVHGLNIIFDSAEVIQFFRDHGRNWVTSSLPLDEPIKGDSLRYVNDAPRVSAGHEKHEWTSWSSLQSIFKFLDEKYHSFISRNAENSTTQEPTANL